MSIFTTNQILKADSYKSSHWLQYAPGVTEISSYIESRGGAYEELPFVGIQAFIASNLMRPITAADVDEAQAFLIAHGDPFNTDDWMTIVNDHGGVLPLEIEALPEGTIVAPGVPMVQIRNTDPRMPWLASYVETALLRAIWYPTTVAARSRRIKQIISASLRRTSDDSGGLPFKLHDFGPRGASSSESSALGGLGHLVNFVGSDNLEATWLARSVYHEDMASFSIPAAEHSTVTSWGREGEEAAYRNMVQTFTKSGRTVAVVSDSYDIYNAVTNIWGGILRDEVIESGGTVVIRPDSGDPTIVPVTVIAILAKKFGYTTNSKGFKVLPNFVRVIQGDGVDETSIPKCLDNLERAGFSADNIFFGMGGQLLQGLNRDTCRFAMKASAKREREGWTAIGKDPITDPGKRQKFGRVAVVSGPDGRPAYVPEEDVGSRKNLLQPVWRNGQTLLTETLADMRLRAEIVEPE